MPIPDPTSWRNLTQESKLTRRGSNIAVIDRALDIYWDAVRQIRPFAVQAEALLAVISAGNTWLKRKASKSVSSFKLINRNLHQKRKSAVSQLVSSSIEVIAFLAEHAEFASANQGHDLRARSHYEKHRFKQLSSGRPQVVKQLDSAYAPERQLWLTSNKTKNVAGSMVHPLHDDMRKGMHGKLSGELKRIANKKGSALTASDWQVLKTFCLDHGIDSHDANSSQCRYLRRAERMVGLLFVNNQGLFESYDGSIVDMWTGGNNPPLYVMDRYGNFYTDDSKDISWGGKFANHSSILSGQEVICAGNAHIKQGRLLVINNNSGHYKPSREHLAECVKVLLDEGADLTKTQVVLKRFQGSHAFDDTWNRVDDFLVPNSKPDSTRQRH
ncbi:MAG: hypothetical protein H6834_16625 [Planctomycetes bacterium]|nr:hypothetical protein [Planctomycetota bacterium]